MPITRSKFDLAVFMVEDENGLIGNWLYSSDLFEKSTILRMAGHFETLLGNVVAHPQTRLSALEILSEIEKQQRDSDQQQRKQSRLKQLMTLEPTAVTLSNVEPASEE
jgi:non-ribosomal peptide synthetase component F